MFRNKTSKQHNFATVPRADIPRSKFPMRQTRKMGFNASELIPIMCEEVLPGDTWDHRENLVARLATPIAPVIDDLDLETFYFFVPNRIVWPDWEDFITGADDELSIPTISGWDNVAAVPKVIPGSVFDHFGLRPGSYNADVFKVNVIPIWGYFTIWNEWFRDQNLQEEWTWSANWTYSSSDTIDQGATNWDQMPLRVNKRHDYFTSSLPWPQKGDAVELPLGTVAPVVRVADSAAAVPTWKKVGDVDANSRSLTLGNNTTTVAWNANAPASAAAGAEWVTTGLQADLAAATAATINSIRLAFQTQKLLERDARGGSRYVEQLLSHFGVRSPDYRLQRPEYLGGSRIPVSINPVAQTAAYDAEPADAASPVGNLGGEMHASGSKRSFTYAATEHGYILGFAVVRATPTYQQGTRRHWRRLTRFDYYFPVFAMLGEQAVATQEIFQPTGTGVPTEETWGYQERWAEYRYTPNEITGPLRSDSTNPMDWWHLSEEFDNEPALNASFITDKTQEVLTRALAVDVASSEQWACQIIMDIQHDASVARLMPTYSVPGMIDHF